MPVLQCFGWECPRLISVSQVPGGNPAARADPEGFAMKFSVCLDCHKTFCDRCVAGMRRGLRRPRCPTCRGGLANGKREADIDFRPKPEQVCHYDQGVELGNAGRFADALTELDRAVLLRPEFPAAHFYRGIALRELGRHEEALAAMDRAIQLNPSDVQALFDKAGIFRQLKRLPEALATYAQALRIQPRYTSAMINMGITSNELGRHEEALTVLDEAVRLYSERQAVDSPGYGMSYAQGARGAALTNLGRYDEALAAIETALSTGPDNPLIHYNRGHVLEQLGRHEEARLAYRVSQELRDRQ